MGEVQEMAILASSGMCVCVSVCVCVCVHKRKRELVLYITLQLKLVIVHLGFENYQKEESDSGCVSDIFWL